MNIYSLLKKEAKMPNKDGTGPQGKGPRTGRGLGNCRPKVAKSPKKARRV